MKKFKLEKKIVFALLFGALLFPSAGAVESVCDSDNNPAMKEEVIEITAQDNRQESILKNDTLAAEEDAAETEEASTYEARNAPLTEYYFTKIEGKYKINNEWKTDPQTFSPRYGSESTIQAQGLWDINEPIHVTYYKYGNGSGLGFKRTAQYEVSATESPFDFVYNSYGDAVGYKQREEITFTDKTLSEITLTSTERSRVAPMNTFTRKIKIQFAQN